jgi:hypothetical protein
MSYGLNLYPSYPIDFYTEVAKGNIAKHSLIHKFGAGVATTTIAPVTISGFYRVPTTATALEFVSSSANDTSAGSGAREVTIQGLDSSWNLVTQTLTTNGTTAVALTTNLVRLFRWYVSSSGTYATQTTGSHAGTLTIQESGGGNVWSQISITPFPLGQSEIACYTVPAGHTAYLLSKNVSVDGVKNVDVYFFQRPNADDVSTPYSGAMRMIEKEIGVSGSIDFRTVSPKGPFVGPCDLGYMAVASTGTVDVSAEFELLLVED